MAVRSGVLMLRRMAGRSTCCERSLQARCLHLLTQWRENTRSANLYSMPDSCPTPLHILSSAAHCLLHSLASHAVAGSPDQCCLFAQVLAALRDTNVPVPRVLCLATDNVIIGTPFYVMEHVQVIAETLTCSGIRMTCWAWSNESSHHETLPGLCAGAALKLVGARSLRASSKKSSSMLICHGCCHGATFSCAEPQLQSVRMSSMRSAPPHALQPRWIC